MAFPSVYEMFVEDLTTVRKQHFWEYFSGATLNSRWTTTLVSSGTVSIADSVDGGVKLGTSGSGHKATISLGGKRFFNYENSVFIASFKFDATQSSTIQSIALSNTSIGSPRDSGLNTAGISDASNGGVIYVDHGDGGGAVVNTATTKATDTSFHTAKISLNASSHITTTIDGDAIGSTITSDVPVHRMAPVVHLASDTTKNLHVNYIEAYNT